MEHFQIPMYDKNIGYYYATQQRARKYILFDILIIW